MLFGIARFELRYQLKNPVFWVSVLIFFLLGFGLTASENVSIGTPGAVHENAPYAITIASTIMTVFYLLVVTAFVANAIVRDDTSGFAPVIRATRVSGHQLVLGRFLGGIVAAWLGFLAVPIGMFLGSVMPWIDPETVGPQVFSYYAWPFLIMSVPNILFLCAILFSIATIFRSMLASYIGAIGLVMVYLVASGVIGQKIEYREMFARFDPIGAGALRQITAYWTQAEMNGSLVPLTGNLLFNRLLVIALAAAFIGLALWRFSMTEKAPSKRALKRLAKREARQAQLAAIAPDMDGGRVIARDSRPSRLIQFMTRVRVEVRQVLSSPGTIVLVLFGIANTAAFLWLSDSTYGTTDHATVAASVDGVRGGFSLVTLLIAGFYGGELVWRERDRKFNELIDSTATPAWILTIPKIIAIFLVMVAVNFAGMLTGLVYAATNGSPSLGIGAFVSWFLVPASIDALLFAVLAVFFQVLSPNKYVGWGYLFAFFVISIFMSNLGWSNPLYNYGNGPGAPLSDFVGRGSFWKGGVVFQVYWGLFAIILVTLAHMLWPRGTDLSLRQRVRRAIRTRPPAPLAIIGVAAVAMAATGAYAYDNIARINRYQTSDDLEKYAADYERKYLKMENVPQPAVTHVKMDAQLFPEQRKLIVDGVYELQNKTDQPIREIHLRKADEDVQWLSMAVAGAKLASDDEDFGYRIYRFAQPLAPGAKSRVTFKSQLWRRGFRAGAPATDLVENGTFANKATFAPIVGMDRNFLLQDRTERRRQGLPAELKVARLEDMSATRRNYIGADWVTSDITLTTDADQVPIAPGKRVSDVTKNGRRTARFVSEAPILDFFSIQSADYEVARKNSNGVGLEVYYLPQHDWNVPKMLTAMDRSLKYYRKNFGPYQFDYARIIEFPRYASFAQAFAGTMPYSESIGFVADTTDPDAIDFTTYVIAHEIAHQYWAHQVVGSDQQGGTVTSETLAQYSALMVLKELYGAEKIRRFLKYELDAYLRGRQGDVLAEQPLGRVENQQYVHYRKGSLAMYLLQERLGEDAVNRALSRFVAKWRFKGPPYLRSTDLVDEFRKEARTPEQQQLITDLFERITVYDLKVEDAKTVKQGNGWATTMTVDAGKYYAAGKGEEKATPLKEDIEVGLFTGRPGIDEFSKKDVLVMKRVPVKSGKQRITLLTAAKPTFAGVDPYNYYIDRNSEDNVKEVD